MTARAKLLVIGLDAASGPTIRAWAAEGILTNFAALIRRGRTATIRGVEGFFTGGTWPTLLTSTTPAHHGIHYLVQLVSGTYQYARPHQAEYIRAPMFWESLCKAGKEVAILDVPLSKLDPNIRGIQTVEWGGHDAIFGFRTVPPRLAGEILERFGTHPVPSDCDGAGRTAADFKQFVDILVRGIEAKARLTIELVGRQDWDLFLQVFTETHCVGHQCWHLHDPDHAAHDPSFIRQQGDPVERVYRAIDKAVGDVIAAAGDPPVLVIMPHGIANWYGPHVLLPEILFRLGLAVRPAPVTPQTRPMDLVRALYRRLPEPIKALVRRAKRPEIPAAPGSFGLPALGVDPKGTRCFVVPNGLAVSGIRVNLAGREPQGIVAPGEEVDALFHQLSRDLLEIRDVHTGRPLAKRVFRTSDLYQGPNLDLLPDFLVEWHDGVARGSTLVGDGGDPTIRARSPKIGEVEAINQYGRTGEHRAEGLLIAAGPGIHPGDHLTVSTLDIAPTITAALGVDLPGAQGRPIREMTPSISPTSAGR